jgi:hypothetical protein
LISGNEISIHEVTTEQATVQSPTEEKALDFLGNNFIALHLLINTSILYYLLWMFGMIDIAVIYRGKKTGIIS